MQGLERGGQAAKGAAGRVPRQTIQKRHKGITKTWGIKEKKNPTEKGQKKNSNGATDNKDYREAT